MVKKVTIYTAPYCPHCKRAKDLLRSKGVVFEEIDVTQNEQKRAEAEEKTGWQTVPMIFIGEEFIGGADDLFSLEDQGKLGSQLASE